NPRAGRQLIEHRCRGEKEQLTELEQRRLDYFPNLRGRSSDTFKCGAIGEITRDFCVGRSISCSSTDGMNSVGQER
ncbi:hypothetical protein JOB18_026068, partial [Solea senegalensis]